MPAQAVLGPAKCCLGRKTRGIKAKGISIIRNLRVLEKFWRNVSAAAQRTPALFLIHFVTNSKKVFDSILLQPILSWEDEQ
jgi:hypothetical protein